MSKKTTINIPESAGPKFSLMNEIKDCPLYKKTDHNADARKFLTEKLKTGGMRDVMPGQLIMFEYLEPATKEQLEYYDAGPCTIFFGSFNSKNGLRILGFNIHYYPAKIRYHVMSKIFDIYKPVYSKYFDKPLPKEIDAFDYKYLMDSLKKAKLDFGVREYIPDLCGKTWKIPANMWHVAVFTEGFFKKRTREAIINYWNQWVSNYYKKDSNKPAKKAEGGEKKQEKKSFWSKMKDKIRKKKK